MNKEKAKALLPVITGWLEGKEIQYRLIQINKTWSPWITYTTVENSDPAFDNELSQWRIKPEVKEGWINIYPPKGDRMDHIRSGYISKADADNAAAPTRIACIKITYTEGEGL